MPHFFYKGVDNLLDGVHVDLQIQLVKKELSKILETRNLSFLIGSGCSLGENGIPTMKQMADNFFESSEEKIKQLKPHLKKLLLSKEHTKFLVQHKIDFTKEPFRNNLEVFLGTLYSLKFYLEQINDTDELTEIDKVITQTKNYILYQCLNEENKSKDNKILENYRNFYRKLSLRDSNLPKPNVFSTNYDLYSEKVMDELGITFTNGFSGFIERYFNPSIFNYALAEQMDISSFKWNVIDSFIYLFKIHGSVNWVEVEETNKLFNVQELQSVDYDYLSKRKNLMIYPSPIKQNASLGSPYSDLFREFQRRIAQNQSILITMGYSFSDEHINNLIYQALTISTFRIVIFSDLIYKTEGGIKSRENIEKLRKLNDPRIWIIGSDSYSEEGVEKEKMEEEANEELVDNKQEEAKDDSKQDTPEDVEKDAHDDSVVQENQILSGITEEENCLHFFSTITNILLPDWTENKIEEKNAEIINLLHKNSENHNRV